jgi:UDP-3-O-acyl-N-acetylglucosamine deacetylase
MRQGRALVLEVSVQNTVKSAVSFKGTGLHNGKQA